MVEFISGRKGREVDGVGEACSSCLKDRWEWPDRRQRRRTIKGMERPPGHPVEVDVDEGITERQK